MLGACSPMSKEDAVGRWESFRIRQTDPICQQWLILHKVDNNDQMRCAWSPTQAMCMPTPWISYAPLDQANIRLSIAAQ